MSDQSSCSTKQKVVRKLDFTSTRSSNESGSSATTGKPWVITKRGRFSEGLVVVDSSRRDSISEENILDVQCTCSRRGRKKGRDIFDTLTPFSESLQKPCKKTDSDPFRNTNTSSHNPSGTAKPIRSEPAHDNMCGITEGYSCNILKEKTKEVSENEVDWHGNKTPIKHSENASSSSKSPVLYIFKEKKRKKSTKAREKTIDATDGWKVVSTVGESLNEVQTEIVPCNVTSHEKESKSNNFIVTDCCDNLFLCKPPAKSKFVEADHTDSSKASGRLSEKHSFSPSTKSPSNFVAEGTPEKSKNLENIVKSPVFKISSPLAKRLSKYKVKSGLVTKNKDGSSISESFSSVKNSGDAHSVMSSTSVNSTKLTENVIGYVPQKALEKTSCCFETLRSIQGSNAGTETHVQLNVDNKSSMSDESFLVGSADAAAAVSPPYKISRISNSQMNCRKFSETINSHSLVNVTCDFIDGTPAIVATKESSNKIGRWKPPKSMKSLSKEQRNPGNKITKHGKLVRNDISENKSSKIKKSTRSSIDKTLSSENLFANNPDAKNMETGIPSLTKRKFKSKTSPSSPSPNLNSALTCDFIGCTPGQNSTNSKRLHGSARFKNSSRKETMGSVIHKNEDVNCENALGDLSILSADIIPCSLTKTQGEDKSSTFKIATKVRKALKHTSTKKPSSSLKFHRESKTDLPEAESTRKASGLCTPIKNIHQVNTCDSPVFKISNLKHNSKKNHTLQLNNEKDGFGTKIHLPDATSATPKKAGKLSKKLVSSSPTKTYSDIKTTASISPVFILSERIALEKESTSKRPRRSLNDESEVQDFTLDDFSASSENKMIHCTPIKNNFGHKAKNCDSPVFKISKNLKSQSGKKRRLLKDESAEATVPSKSVPELSEGLLHITPTKEGTIEKYCESPVFKVSRVHEKKARPYLNEAGREVGNTFIDRSNFTLKCGSPTFETSWNTQIPLFSRPENFKEASSSLTKTSEESVRNMDPIEKSHNKKSDLFSIKSSHRKHITFRNIQSDHFQKNVSPETSQIGIEVLKTPLMKKPSVVSKHAANDQNLPYKSTSFVKETSPKEATPEKSCFIQPTSSPVFLHKTLISIQKTPTSTDTENICHSPDFISTPFFPPSKKKILGRKNRTKDFVTSRSHSEMKPPPSTYSSISRPTDRNKDINGQVQNPMNVSLPMSGRGIRSKLLLDTEAIDEFDTEALNLGKAKEELKTKLLKATATEPDVSISQVNSGKDVTVKEPKVKDKKSRSRVGPLQARVEAFLRKKQSERRVRIYEREKAGVPLQGIAKDFRVIDVSNTGFPLRVYALEDDGLALVIINKGVVANKFSVYPGCWLKIYPPWDVIQPSVGGVKTYLSICTCTITYDKVLDLNKALNKGWTSADQYLANPDLFIDALLGQVS